MTKFEQTAINRQYEAYRKDWAVKQFNISCNICCLTGRHSDCDKCNIAYVHRLIIAALDEKEGKK